MTNGTKLQMNIMRSERLEPKARSKHTLSKDSGTNDRVPSDFSLIFQAQPMLTRFGDTTGFRLRKELCQCSATKASQIPYPHEEDIRDYRSKGLSQIGYHNQLSQTHHSVAIIDIASSTRISKRNVNVDGRGVSSPKC